MTLEIRDYLLSVVAAALICGIIRALLPEKGTIGTTVKLLLGLAMILAVVSPWSTISTGGLLDWKNDIAIDSDSIITDAENSVNEQMRQHIIQQTESYILAKADSLGAQIDVTVEVSDGTVATPSSVRIKGAVSPYAKQVISQMITDELGISREEQEWT